MERKKIASKLKPNDVVEVMGVEYYVESAEVEAADVDLWLEPVDDSSEFRSHITLNISPKAEVHVKRKITPRT